MCPVNTVVNAFHYRALVLMSRIASALGKAEDGEGSSHASLHGNMFAIAFNLVPDDQRPGVISFVKARSMACSVYGAQFLLEALYLSDEDNYALDLMTARHVFRFNDYHFC